MLLCRLAPELLKACPTLLFSFVTPHVLTDADLRNVARRTDGLSGSDISVLVRDALMEPVRALQAATHFRERPDGNWEPCGPRERGARSMRLMEVPAARLHTPEVRHEHLQAAAAAARGSVGKEDLARYEEFTREFGAGN